METMTRAEQIRAEVKEEVLATQHRRSEAMKFSSSHLGQPMPPRHLASSIQEISVAEDRAWLTRGINANWPDLWSRLCRKAELAGKRPIPFLVGIIEDYLGPADD